MARRKKGIDLVLIEALVPLVGIGLLLIYLKDPNVARGLFQIIPMLAVGVIGVGIVVALAWFFISSGNKLTTQNIFPDMSRGDTAVLPRRTI